MPGVDHAGLRIPHMKDSHRALELGAVFFQKMIQFPVDDLEGVLLVRRPQLPLLDPNRVEIAAADHQVGGSLDDKFRVDLDHVPLRAARGDQ